MGQPASLPLGLGRSSVGQVCNLPLLSGRLETCPTTDCAARTGAQQTAWSASASGSLGSLPKHRGSGRDIRVNPELTIP